MWMTNVVWVVSNPVPHHEYSHVKEQPLETCNHWCGSGKVGVTSNNWFTNKLSSFSNLDGVITRNIISTPADLHTTRSKEGNQTGIIFPFTFLSSPLGYPEKMWPTASTLCKCLRERKSLNYDYTLRFDYPWGHEHVTAPNSIYPAFIVWFQSLEPNCIGHSMEHLGKGRKSMLLPGKRRT